MIYCEDCSSYDCGCPEANEIKSLRQQLASREAEIAELVVALEGIKTPVEFWVSCNTEFSTAYVALLDLINKALAKVRKP